MLYNSCCCCCCCSRLSDS